VANGRLGGGVSVNNTNLVVYTVPTTVEFTTLNILISNTSSVDVTMRLSIGLNSIPSLEDFIEYDIIIPAKGSFERTALICSTNEKIIVNADSDALAIRVNGLEQPLPTP